MDSGKTLSSEERPAGVSETKQAGEAAGRWTWVERAVRTERMLEALETGVKGGMWFSLMDKVYAVGNLKAAFRRVRANQGASGVDHVTVKHFEERWGEELEELHQDLKEGRYGPQRIRRVDIDKPGRKQKRPLGIPTVRVLTLLESFLGQEVLEELQAWQPERGCPQGAVISPLLAHIYLNPLDQRMQAAGFEMIRYADDLVVLCRQPEAAKRALELLQEWMETVGLRLHPEKTKIIDLTEACGFTLQRKKQVLPGSFGAACHVFKKAEM